MECQIPFPLLQQNANHQNSLRTSPGLPMGMRRFLLSLRLVHEPDIPQEEHPDFPEGAVKIRTI